MATYTLLDLMTEHRRIQAAKHDLGADHAEDSINALSNYELVCELSEALEKILYEREASL